MTSLALSTAPTNLTQAQYMGLVVENCGHHSKKTKELLRASRSLALKAETDTLQGTGSKHGFEAMFKENSAKTVVGAILDALYYHKLIRGLRPMPDIPKAPRISCVAPGSAQMYKTLDLSYDPWQKCWQEKPSPGFYAEGTAHIFLCPAFFALEDSNDHPNCPNVLDNKFSGDPVKFFKGYQIYTLLYFLIRFYLGHNALDNSSDPREQLDWNNCMSLVLNMVVDAVRNPTSIQLYVACRSALDGKKNHVLMLWNKWFRKVARKYQKRLPTV